MEHKALYELGFVPVERFVHDEFATLRFRYGKMTVELTYDELTQQLLTSELTIAEHYAEPTTIEQLTLLYAALNLESAKVVVQRLNMLELLIKYFEKNQELQLAMDGKHPQFKETLENEVEFPKYWNRYVQFCNESKRELRELAIKIKSV